MHRLIIHNKIYNMHLKKGFDFNAWNIFNVPDLYGLHILMWFKTYTRIKPWTMKFLYNFWNKESVVDRNSVVEFLLEKFSEQTNSSRPNKSVTKGKYLCLHLWAIYDNNTLTLLAVHSIQSLSSNLFSCHLPLMYIGCNLKCTQSIRTAVSSPDNISQSHSPVFLRVIRALSPWLSLTV